MSLTKFEKDPTEKGLFDKIQEIIETILGFATVAKTGSYNDLTDKPTVPGEQIQSDWNQTTTTAKDYIKNKPTIPAAQIQSDWNQTTTTALDYIKNKPTLFSGSYNDLTNKPTIPAAQIQSDWNQTTTTALDYIKNKPTLFSGNYNDLTNKPTIPSAVTESTVSDWGFTKNAGTVTKVNGISPVSGNVTLSIPAAQIQADWNQTTASALDYIKNKPTLFSGSYNDLTDKPTIPSAVTESTVSGWGFTKNAGTVTSVNNTAPVNGNVTLTIPSAVTESTVSGWGFTKFNGSYTSLTNVPSSFTPSAHNQASSTINALTSYSKSVSGGTGALSTSDTLNKALAKLENALDGKQASGNYLTGITSSMVISALGYTPYSSANPNGYTSNTGTITGIKMNGSSMGTSGVVDLGTVLTSHQSLTGYLQNTATGTNSLTISGTATTATSAVNIGATSTAGGGYSTAVGYYAASNGARSTSIGYGARIGASTADAIQIGNGTNSTAKSLCVGFYNTANYILLDGTTGLIPDDRLSSNIARTSAIPTYNFYGDPFYSTDGDTTGITKACDSLTANGHYYYTSGGPSGLGEQSTDGAIYVQGYNDNWVTQIAQDYRTGNLFVRSRNNGTWVSWKAIANKSDIPDTSSFVSKSGDTMTGDLYFSNCSTAIITPATKGTNPSEAIWKGIAFNDNTNDSEYANTRLGIVEYNLDTSGGSHIYLRAYKNTANNTNNATFSLDITSAGVASCSFPNTTCADGQWVVLNQNLHDGSLASSSGTDLPLTVNIPNDGKVYDVLFSVAVETGSTSGNAIYVNMGNANNGMFTTKVQVAGCRTRTNSTVGSRGCVILPMKYASKNLAVTRTASLSGTANITAVAYRRNGTNT